MSGYAAGGVWVTVGPFWRWALLMGPLPLQQQQPQPPILVAMRACRTSVSDESLPAAAPPELPPLRTAPGAARRAAT